MEHSEWHCICQAGWSGSACSVTMEMECNDSTDNDGGEPLTLRSRNFSVKQTTLKAIFLENQNQDRETS